MVDLHLGLFVLLGFAIGALGTLIGAGGGFILLPILLLLYPDAPPEHLTAISLAVVFFNAGSGSIAYARLKRIDYRSGLPFALATLPGAVLGAYATRYIPRHVFDAVLGTLLLALALFLLLKPKYRFTAMITRQYRTYRIVTDRDGTVYKYSFNMVTGILISVVVGFLSSILGIGGGIIHVPVLSLVLHFPVALATATSHFILAIMSFAGTCAHALQGNLHNSMPVTLSIGMGSVAGAQLGAWLSHRTQPVWIIRALASALLLVAIRLLPIW